MLDLTQSTTARLMRSIEQDISRARRAIEQAHREIDAIDRALSAARRAREFHKERRLISNLTHAHEVLSQAYEDLATSLIALYYAARFIRMSKTQQLTILARASARHAAGLNMTINRWHSLA